jgi:hypothetical protein
MKRLLLVVCVLAPLMAARDQCVPGPFTYDDGGQFTDGAGNGGGGFIGPDNCFDPSCPDFVCTSDNECAGFFGQQAECIDGRCITFQPCQLGQPNDFCVDSGAGTCAYDADSEFPHEQGVCKIVAPNPLGLGERCPLDLPNLNPCGGGGYCLPLSDVEGVCVVGCGNTGECNDGFNCAAPYLLTGGTPACMPACNLDTPSCGDARLICVPSQFDGSCTPDTGACVIAGCDDDECFDLCTPGADECGAGSFCIETRVDNCRVDAPDQTFAACAPPAGQGQPCALTEAASCQNGLACAPVGIDAPQCIQQSASAVNDGDPCDPNATDANRCPAGSYCAPTAAPSGSEGVCQRFCDDVGDCDAGQACARANLVRFGSNAYDDVHVCAETCAANTTCANGFVCDVDGASCTSEGACVPNEGFNFCNSDDDCDAQQDFVCSRDRRCVAPEDVCIEQPCVLTDAATCPALFACSPFGTDTPVCVPQRDVVPDGGNCNPNDTAITQCAAGSVCANGVCMRACEDNSGCSGAQECARGNLMDATVADDPFRLANIKVCADPCVPSGGTCGGAFSCDVDDGASCSSGPGHCLPFESSPQGCSNNVECAALAGTVCDTTQTACLPPQDLCTP